MPVASTKPQSSIEIWTLRDRKQERMIENSHRIHQKKNKNKKGEVGWMPSISKTNKERGTIEELQQNFSGLPLEILCTQTVKYF
jgi:hypothetical protein